MNQTQFDNFLKESNIQIKDLPDPIQEKIEIHQDLSGQLEDTLDEDRKKLERKLQQLDEEIYDDLLNEFEDQLENNEIVEQPETAIIKDKPIEKEKTSKEEKEAQEEVKETKEEESRSSESQKRQQSDEAKDSREEEDPNELILDKIYASGKTDNLSKSYLRSLGLKLNFAQWEIPVGKYLLHRNSVFHIRFRLAKS